MSDDLISLLHKCHRDELEGLARILRIKPRGMRLNTLARAIESRLRRSGANEVANAVLRRGRGPDYATVLGNLGQHLRLALPRDVTVAEQAIAHAHARTQWRQLPDSDRAALWEAASEQPPVPDGGADIVAILEKKHRRGMGYHLARMFHDPPVPPLGCLFTLYLAKPRWDLLLPAVLEVHRLRTALRHRVTVGVVGSPSSGKDAAIAAVFGVHSGNINPVAGSTKKVEITQLPDATALFIVNTPGMGDVVQEVTEEAREVLDHIDVYVYVVNAQGGVQARELSDYAAIRERDRPVLAVINKIDTLRDDDRARYLADAQQKLGAADADFLSAAFDPLPQLSATPLGVEPVRAWLEHHLGALGKDTAELPWVEPRD